VAEVDRRLAAVGAEQASLRARWLALDDEGRGLVALRADLMDRGRELSALPPPPLPPPPLPPPPLAAPPAVVGAGALAPRPEVHPITLRNLLLVLGASLLGLAAIVFVAVAWPRLDDTGRGAVLGGVTLVVGGLSAVLASRLRATAEALAAVLVVLLLVDWHALDRVGVDGDLDPLAWWAMGMAVAGSLSIAIARTLHLQVGRVAGSVLVALAVVPAVVLIDEPVVAAIVLAGVASTTVATAAALWRWPAWRPTSVAVLASAGMLETAGAVAVVAAVAEHGPGWPAALALLAVVMPVAVVRATWPASQPAVLGDVEVAVTTTGALAALALGLAGSLTGGWLAASVAAVAGLVLAAARPAAPWARLGVASSALGVLTLAALGPLLAAVEAAVSPLVLLQDPWSLDPALVAGDHVPDIDDRGRLVTDTATGLWSVAVALAVVGLGAAATAWDRLPGRPLARWDVAAWPTAAASTGALLVGALATDLSIAAVALGGIAVAVIAAAVAVLGARADRGVAVGLSLAGVLVVSSLGWAVADPGLMAAALVELGVGAAVTAGLTERLRGWLAAVAATTLVVATPVGVLAAGGSGAAQGLATAVAGSIALAVGGVALRAQGAPVRAAVVAPGALAMVAALLASTEAFATDPWPVVATVALVAVAALVAAPRCADREVGAMLAGGGVALGLIGVALVAVTLDAVAPAVGLAGTLAASVVIVAAAVQAPTRWWRTAVLTTGVVGVTAGIAGSLAGWAEGPWLAVGSVGAAVLAAGIAAGVGRGAAVEREGFAAATGLGVVAVAALSAVAAGATPDVVGLVATTAAGLVAVTGSLVQPQRRGAAVVVAGLVALGLAIPMAYAEPVSGAIAITLVVPVLLVTSLRPGWRWALWAASGAALVATWSWLVAAEVTVLEAYTLPAAVAALVAGWVRRHDPPFDSSWLAYGPGLLLALAPSTIAALEGDVARALAVVGAGVVVVLIGVRSRLQAPLAMGSLAVLVVALDALAPVAGRVPRWMELAVAGVLLLWLGATIERRLRQAHRWWDGFGHLH
jgi:hypothetical protein